MPSKSLRVRALLTSDSLLSCARAAALLAELITKNCYILPPLRYPSIPDIGSSNLCFTKRLRQVQREQGRAMLDPNTDLSKVGCVDIEAPSGVHFSRVGTCIGSVSFRIVHPFKLCLA